MAGAVDPSAGAFLPWDAQAFSNCHSPGLADSFSPRVADRLRDGCTLCYLPKAIAGLQSSSPRTNWPLSDITDTGNSHPSSARTGSP